MEWLSTERGLLLCLNRKAGRRQPLTFGHVSHASAGVLEFSGLTLCWLLPVCKDGCPAPGSWPSLRRKGKRGPSMFAYFFFKIQKFLKKYLQQTSYRVSLARTGSHGLLYQQGRLGTWEMGWSWLIWTTRHLWPETGDLGAWIKIRGLLSREKGWDKFWTHNEQGLPQVV